MPGSGEELWLGVLLNLSLLICRVGRGISCSGARGPGKDCLSHSAARGMWEHTVLRTWGGCECPGPDSALLGGSVPLGGWFQGHLVAVPSWGTGISQARKRHPPPGAALTQTWGLSPLFCLYSTDISLFSFQGKGLYPGAWLLGEWALLWTLGPRRPASQPQRVWQRAEEWCDWVCLFFKQRGSFVTVGKSISSRSWVGAGAWSAHVMSWRPPACDAHRPIAKVGWACLAIPPPRPGSPRGGGRAHWLRWSPERSWQRCCVSSP